MNSWIVAGLIAGVVMYLVDWVLWSKVFNNAGVAAIGGHMSPEEMKSFMGPALAKSAVLSLAFGVLFAWVYSRFRGALWGQGGGGFAGIGFAAVLLVPICFGIVCSRIWAAKIK